MNAILVVVSLLSFVFFVLGQAPSNKPTRIPTSLPSPAPTSFGQFASGYLKTTYYNDIACSVVSKQVLQATGICFQKFSATGVANSSFLSLFSTSGNTYKETEVVYADTLCTLNPTQNAVIPGQINICVVSGTASYMSFYSANQVVPELYSGGLDLT